MWDIGVSREMINKKRFATRWVFAFIAFTLFATNWLTSLIGPRVDFK
jgi:hypothetical protein